jgi:thiamine biosynthesis lipoprotein
MVMIRIARDPGSDKAGIDVQFIRDAVAAAFGVIERIGRVMSAHRIDSDLARLARAFPGSLATVDRHTVRVLRLAKYWHASSRGAFDPVAAARQLAARGMRPAFEGVPAEPGATLHDIEFLSDSVVRLEAPLQLDLGGIAKGYAVDEAVEILRGRGIGAGLVNAGGDLRAFGLHDWPVEARSCLSRSRTVRLKGLRSLTAGALASSEAAPSSAEFVWTLRRTGVKPWKSCTVFAPDCATADALTKWGLQAHPESVRLHRFARMHKARLWRS